MKSAPRQRSEDGERLVYVDDSMPGITRRRLGRGPRVAWVYFDPRGERIRTQQEIDRLNAVGLPPAYDDAWFCPAPNGHILATGVDARGRKQYRYNPAFRAAREAEKFDRTAAFGRLLPLVRARVEIDLAAKSLSRERAIASVVRLLDSGAIRVGNAAYAKANKSFGATTLKMRHAELKGSELRLRFRAKGGIMREKRVDDRGLARFVRKMQDLPGQQLFQYLDDAGEACPVCSQDVNAYLCETMGEHFTAKNFRTWHASVLAFEAIGAASDPVTMKELMTQVSGQLGNTPAIARKSYVHPAVVALLDRQIEWRKHLRFPRATRWLSRAERGLIAMLDGAEALSAPEALRAA